MIKKIIKRFLSFAHYEDSIHKLYTKSHRYTNKNNKINNYLIDMYNYKMYKEYNCIISGRAVIKSKLKLPHPVGIVIGGDFGNITTVIGKNVTIYQNVTIGRKDDNYPKIGDNVIIYAGAVVIGDVHIGNNVIIGANAVVTHDVPDNCVVAGIPAKIIKRIND